MSEPSGSRKKKERRSSILKTTTAFRREPLQDVANSPSKEPTFTGGIKKDRRASLGRRVSFSVANKVKEFRTDGTDYTVWNSTYEEERSNIHTDSSCQKSDGDDDVFADKTFVGNDEMEVTEVLPNQKTSDFLSSLRSDNVQDKTATDTTMSMDITMANLKQKFGSKDDVLTDLQQKFGSKSKAEATITSLDASMEMTAAVPNIAKGHQATSSETVANEDMEMTQAISKTKTATFQHSNQTEANMEMTEIVKLPKNVQIENEAPKNDEMEMTEVLPTQKTSGFLSSLRSGNAQEKASADEDMEMTQAITKSKIAKVPKQTPNQSNETEQNMEMTEVVKLPKNVQIEKESENPDESLMEMTEAVPSISKLKKNVVEEADMEMTAAVPTIPKSVAAETKKVGNDNDMEMTEAVPSISQLKKAVVEETDMEMTAAVPTVAKPKPAETKTVGNENAAEETEMEMTQAINKSKLSEVSKQSQEHSNSTEHNMEMTEIIKLPKTAQIEKESEKNDESLMEMTEAVPSISKLKKTFAEETDMEMTAGLATIGKVHQTTLSKTVAMDEMDHAKAVTTTNQTEQNMEMTEVVKLPKTAQILKESETRDDESLMEMTAAVPTLPKSDANEKKRIENENDMEMTGAVPILPRQIQDENDTTIPNNVSLSILTTHDMIELPDETLKGEVFAFKAEPKKEALKRKSSEFHQSFEANPKASVTSDMIEIPNILAEKTEPPVEEANESILNITSNEEFEERMKNRRQYIEKMRQFLADLDSSSTNEESPEVTAPPIKKSKLTEVSVFDRLVEKQGERMDHGHWTLLERNETNVTFGFFLNRWQIHLVLGHFINKGGPVKHWNIRKVTLTQKGGGDNDIQLTDALFAKEWTPERLASTFKTTEHLDKSLAVFGASVNDAVQFALDMVDIAGNHCSFKVDPNEMKVCVEFFSMKKVYSFYVEVSYSNGFKKAKYEGTKLIPGISNGFMISNEMVSKLALSNASGWNYLKLLVDVIDKYVRESEFL